MSQTTLIHTALLILLGVFLTATSETAAENGSRPGYADKVFDRHFLQQIKVAALYEEIVRVVGTPPVRVGASSLKIPGEKYHWNGRQGSALNIRVSAGKVIDGNIVTPEGVIIPIENYGERSVIKDRTPRRQP